MHCMTSNKVCQLRYVFFCFSQMYFLVNEKTPKWNSTRYRERVQPSKFICVNASMHSYLFHYPGHFLLFCSLIWIIEGIVVVFFIIFSDIFIDEYRFDKSIFKWDPFWFDRQIELWCIVMTWFSIWLAQIKMHRCLFVANEITQICYKNYEK